MHAGQSLSLGPSRTRLPITGTKDRVDKRIDIQNVWNCFTDSMEGHIINLGSFSTDI